MRAVRSQNPFELLKRVIDFALAEEYGTESIYRIREVQQKLQRFFVLLSRGRKVSPSEPDIAQIVVRLVAGIVDLDGFAERFLGRVKLHRLEIVETEAKITHFIVRVRC